MPLIAECSTDALASIGLANIRGDYCFASSAIHENNIRPKTFRTFLIFFKVLTNCWMILLFDITL